MASIRTTKNLTGQVTEKASELRKSAKNLKSRSSRYIPILIGISPPVYLCLRPSTPFPNCQNGDLEGFHSLNTSISRIRKEAQNLLGAKNLVTGIPQTWQDIAVLVQTIVDRGCENLHIRVSIQHLLDPFRAATSTRTRILLQPAFSGYQ